MLKSFKVKNFKGFKEQLVFNLSDTNGYEFSAKAVKNGIANKALIYGHNACGKSNLGLAIFDIVLHLTDREKLFNKYFVYLNLDSDDDYASFEYTFQFEDHQVIYLYTKYDMQKLRTEELVIDEETVVKYDYESVDGWSVLEGTQNLRLDSPDGRLSKLKFIRNNAILEENEVNAVFLEFMDFVDNMLMFYSLEERGYQGFMLGIDKLDDAIVKSGKLRDFEQFLHKAGIQEELLEVDVNDEKQIHFNYKNGSVPMIQVASAGTRTLELFYYWYIKISKASFVYIDEFDAFYHHELAEMIIKLLLEETDVQIVLSTHNTDLISNDLLRPDCYYYMNDNKINALSSLTEKELRKAHNLQKMYKAGAFNAKE
jgi:hypothetical protein